MNRIVLPALVSLCIVIASGLILLAMGRDLICVCGEIRFWGQGGPLAESSKHLLDLYTPSHVIHGILFFAALWLVARRLGLGWRLAIATLVEAAWEVAENTDAVIRSYRELPAGAGYSGDSVLNSTADILAMMLGFWLALRAPVWLSVAVIVLFEALTIWLIRDGLALNVLMLVWPSEAIAAWQTGG